ncbi:MAG: T9SS type B sorting domain-containing protein [Flavobacterium sp.]|nr:T9SS type B sorting domain-containing protein [Flavobacterium sp.]
MKKILFIKFILFTYFSYSQNIEVNTTTFSVPQLVNSVLINSTCVNATNISWRTGTNYSSSNGIGFFKNSNPNFPMQSGVILSTGNVMNAAGPNTTILNDGISTWPGDVSLENTLATAGISMVSKNATALEFDFTPISSYFSFDFVFASEEYGNFQCQFSDAFAFLLTNMNTGVTTNLAVVPNTNIPISVVTIRDYNYNSSCPSSNQQFFGRFNGGYNSNNAAINFNGQTKLLTAASTLTPNVPYHIKLVIADRLDPQFDSSIFIAANSLNIGQNALGPDLTIANSTGKCPNTTHLLQTGISPTDYSFTWKKNGIIIPGQTNASLVVSSSGIYTATFTSILSGCVPFSDEITVEYFPIFISPNPNNLYKCNTGLSPYNYNLDLNTSIVKQGLSSSTLITYHISQSDADNNINPLPLSYDSPGGVTIYVRIQVPNNPCYVVKLFQLLLSSPPIANQPLNITKCAANQIRKEAYFNLSSQTSYILNGLPIATNNVSYYTSLNNANSGANPITNIYSYLSYSQTIYVRLQKTTDVNCFSITSFDLIVLSIPLVDHLQNVIVCVSYTLQPLINGNYFTGPNGTGTPMFAGHVITQTQTIYIFNQPNGPGTCGANSAFIVTIADENSLTPKNTFRCDSYTLPSLMYGKYYTGPGGTGTQILPGTVINTTQTIYYYYLSNTTPVCLVDSSFTVIIITNADLGSRPDIFECSSYTLTNLIVGNYYTGPNGTGNQLPAGTIITSNQTIYVYVDFDGITNCKYEDVFDVFIGIQQLDNISQCNGYILPPLPIGNYFTGPSGTGILIPYGTLINQDSIIYIYAQNTTGINNCTDNLHFTLTFAEPVIDVFSNITVCESYTLPPITNGQYFTGTQGTGAILQPGQVLNSTQTIYVFRRLNSTCYNQNSFTVTINAYPLIDSRSDIDVCDQYILTELAVGKYYTGINGTGTQLPANAVITASQLIYIYASTNTTPNCTSQNSFQINIFSATANSSPNITACDSYVLPSLTSNNKYYTKTGGPNGSGTEVLPGILITSNQTLYIFKESIIRTGFSCFDEKLFSITINKSPVIPVISNVNTCNSFTLKPLQIGNYYSASNATGTLLHAGDVITSTQTLYVYAQTNTTPNCFDEKSFTITIFNVDQLQNVTTCESYSLPNLITGNYYNGPNATGGIIPQGSTIYNNKTIYIFANSGFNPNCSDESLFVVTIVDTPVANSVPLVNRTVCDEDGTNDGTFNFNLTTLNSIILGTQNGSEFSVSYHQNNNDATANINSVSSSSSSTVFARVTNTLTSNCFDIKPISIIVNKIPEPKLMDGIICIKSTNGQLINPYTITSGLSTANHTFKWFDEQGQIIGTGTNYTAILPSIYSIIAINTTTGCPSEKTFVKVAPSEQAVVTYAVSEDFSDSQSITITAIGTGGDYEYQLDNGPFQDSPVFDSVMSGLHTITVRDKNGCGITTTDAIVVNYPHYFTPNADGINESWNIKDLKDQTISLIYIYDRYGKLLKRMKPTEQGWDGTYNNSLMPSDDYWFSINYQKDGSEKEFRAHFALKR